VRTGQLIEEMRRDGERRDRELDRRERDARDRHEAAMADMRRKAELTDAFIQENRDVTRAMLAELRDHGERMRLGFDATYGALIDLSREIRGWRDEGGSGATA
jgi:hypothetical protein